MLKTMKVAALQQDIIWGNPEENLKRIEKIIGNGAGADLYVLPEMFTTGFATALDASVDTEPRRTLEWMKSMAKKYDAAFAGSIGMPLCCDDPSGKCVNRLFFVTPEGDVTHYDKRHLFTYGGENIRFVGGNQRVTVEYKGFRFLLLICYDVRFPVWIRNRNDYDAIILVASWPDVRRLAWDTLIRARAIENQCFVIAVNRVGKDMLCSYNGGTRIFHPYGDALAQAEEEKEQLITADLDMESLDSYRVKFPVTADADPFTFNDIDR